MIFKTKPLIKISSFKDLETSCNMNRTIESHILVDNLAILFKKNTEPKPIKKYQKEFRTIMETRNKKIHHTGAVQFKKTFGEHMKTLNMLLKIDKKAI